MLVEQDAALTLRVVDDDGERTIEAQAGRSLLKSLQDASVPVGSVCGGHLSRIRRADRRWRSASTEPG